MVRHRQVIAPHKVKDYFLHFHCLCSAALVGHTDTIVECHVCTLAYRVYNDDALGTFYERVPHPRFRLGENN